MKKMLVKLITKNPKKITSTIKRKIVIMVIVVGIKIIMVIRTIIAIIVIIIITTIITIIAIITNQVENNQKEKKLDLQVLETNNSQIIEVIHQIKRIIGLNMNKKMRIEVDSNRFMWQLRINDD